MDTSETSGQSTPRRNFLKSAGLGMMATALAPAARADDPKIQGFNETDPGKRQDKAWRPVSDRWRMPPSYTRRFGSRTSST